MRILQISDSPWSIGKLTAGIRKYNPFYTWRHLYIPPRDIDENIEKVKIELSKGVDLIDFHYWNVCWQLIEKIPELKKYPKILTHHNQKNILSKDWDEFNIDILCCKTQYSYNKLNEKYPNRVRLIPNVVDFDSFEWNENYGTEKSRVQPVAGYAGRIVPWKGLKEIARACYELKYPLMIMGIQDKINYWNEIPEEYKQNMLFEYYQCPDNLRQNFYNDITIYVGNSREGRESGTLPFLEAMACGVPVVTTPNGMANDLINHEQNGYLVEFENYESLKAGIKKVMEDEELRLKMRKNAWQTIKSYTLERHAREYAKTYRQLLYPNYTCVSVIIPATYDRIKDVNKIIEALDKQNYPNLEAIIIWDEVEVKDGVFGQNRKIVVKQLYTEKTGYNLAMARNLGVIEAEGDILVFCDSRLMPADNNSITRFVEEITKSQDKVWLYGNKGGNKINFVENWSCVLRKDFIYAGMFNERIDRYGAMSQELRNRFKYQGFQLKYLPDIMAVELRSSKLTAQRRKDIIYSKNIVSKLNMGG